MHGPEPIERPPVNGNLADDVACQDPSCQPCEAGAPCEGEKEPGLLGSVFGRFINPGECDPHWRFTADGVALQRSSTRSQPLFTSGATAAPPGLLNSQDLNFPAELGFQLSAVRRGPSGWEWELGYFQIDGWNATSTVGGPSFLVTSSDGAGFDVADDGEAHYRSAIHLAEINLRRQWCDGLTLLVGFRAGELDEIYSASGLDANRDLAGALNIKTFNHLWGFQVGGEYEFYNMGGPLRISALCKAGIYDNSAMQSSNAVVSGVSDDTLEGHRYQSTFIGEAGGVATYQVTCHLALRASCEAVWIENVALAPEQIGANNFTTLTPSIDTHGSIFYYGGGLGVEVKF
jgi:hypothetical protein